MSLGGGGGGGVFKAVIIFNLYSLTPIIKGQNFALSNLNLEDLYIDDVE